MTPFLVTNSFCSGIGLQAARFLVRINAEHRIILVCRTDESAKKALKAVLSGIPPDEASKTLLIPMSCDHTKLESVRQFAKRLPRILNETCNSNLVSPGIDVLCLNAAVLRPKDSPVVFTEDGVEVTFQTNALSPFLLAFLCQHLISPNGRVVVSTSGLYTRTEFSLEGMVDPQTHQAKKGFEMIDGSTFHFKRSYALSKVCNVALTLSLQQRLLPRNISVNCFSPGLMMSSGLFRHQTEHDMATSLAHSKFIRMNEKSVAWGGGSLVYMALSEEVGKTNGMYWSDTDSRKGDAAVYGTDFCPASISTEAIPWECTEELWRICCQLTDVPVSILN